MIEVSIWWFYVNYLSVAFRLESRAISKKLPEKTSLSMAQTIGGFCALAGVREEREAYSPQRTGARSVARFIQQP